MDGMTATLLPVMVTAAAVIIRTQVVVRTLRVNAIRPILIQSCSSQLVNPDGSLTQPDGQKAHDCIHNGIVLGPAGFLAGGGSPTNLPLIIHALEILSGPTGCDGVVN